MAELPHCTAYDEMGSWRVSTGGVKRVTRFMKRAIAVFVKVCILVEQLGERCERENKNLVQTAQTYKI